MSIAPDASSSGIHLVDHDGSFGSTADDVTKFLLKHQISGNNYSVVAILGCQSTGKSTLLNRLFGTSFAMMDQTKGRNQTTRGIWMDCASKVPGLVVLDLEGTDSGERGEDRGSFERQTGLYGLALTEVLIVNMWHHDIGRYTASNYGILRTVFEVNLQLFGSRTKTTILFVIRDHESDTPLSALRDKILAEMAAIWSELRKPDDLLNAPIDTLFSFAFLALPHLKHEAVAFDAKVTELRDWFASPANESYLLQRPDTPTFRAKTVPVDGFGRYAQQVWTSVREHRELNLPSQREMLATFRCDEFANVVAADFAKSIGSLIAEVQEGLSMSFATVATAALNKSCSDFDAAARGYETIVVARKREELHSRLAESLRPHFAINIQHAVVASVAAFTSALNQRVPASELLPAGGPTFAAVVAELSETASASLKAAVQASTVAGVDWPTTMEESELKREIGAAVAARRQEQLQLLVGAERAQVADTDIPRSVTVEFTRYPTDMWSRLRSSFDQVCSTSSSRLTAALKTQLGATDAECQQHCDAIKKAARQVVLSAHRTQATAVTLKMKQTFERSFTNDEQGLPRKWRRHDKPRDAYAVARPRGLSVLELFEKFRLDGDDDSKSMVVMSEQDKAEAIAEYDRNTIRSLDEIEWKQERLNESHVPWWIFALLVVLGWNELMAILTNPLLLVMLLTVGGYVVMTRLDALEDSQFGFAVTYVKNVVNSQLHGNARAAVAQPRTMPVEAPAEALAADDGAKSTTTTTPKKRTLKAE